MEHLIEPTEKYIFRIENKIIDIADINKAIDNISIIKYSFLDLLRINFINIAPVNDAIIVIKNSIKVFS